MKQLRILILVWSRLRGELPDWTLTVHHETEKYQKFVLGTVFFSQRSAPICSFTERNLCCSRKKLKKTNNSNSVFPSYGSIFRVSCGCEHGWSAQPTSAVTHTWNTSNNLLLRLWVNLMFRVCPLLHTVTVIDKSRGEQVDTLGLLWDRKDVARTLIYIIKERQKEREEKNKVEQGKDELGEERGRRDKKREKRREEREKENRTNSMFRMIIATNLACVCVHVWLLFVCCNRQWTMTACLQCSVNPR